MRPALPCPVCRGRGLIQDNLEDSLFQRSRVFQRLEIAVFLQTCFVMEMRAQDTVSCCMCIVPVRACQHVAQFPFTSRALAGLPAEEMEKCSVLCEVADVKYRTQMPHLQ